MTNIPRSEYPRPHLVREKWLSLNGEWAFTLDDARNGEFKNYATSAVFDKKITVPFCPESKLSGLEYTDFMNCVWYKREVEIPKDWCGKRVILHIDACDWECRAFVGGKHVGTHKGGYTPMAFDITDAITDGKALIAIEAIDEVRSSAQVSGKQSRKFASFGCYYTRTTGIWQSVWLEAADAAYVVNYHTVTDIDNAVATMAIKTSEAARGKGIRAVACYEGREVGRAEGKVGGEVTDLAVALSERHLWECGNGRLYDVVIEIFDGDAVLDRVNAYFGLRTVRITKEGMFINGKTVFGRFVLDQGFYPDGLYTAPTDERLKKDITDAQALGFNGARLHQKVFEPRFLYHADKLGYMVFDETGNWGWGHNDKANIYTFLPEWIEEVERDMAHPSVIGWCPFNETWPLEDRRVQDQDMMRLVHDVTKAIDRTRPIIINSGSLPCYDISGNILGDAYDIHDYEQDPEKFKETFKDIDKGEIHDQLARIYGNLQKFDNKKTVFVSEYGGIGWNMSDGWGYGNAVKTEEEFMARLEGLTAVMREDRNVMGFCYTQLTDIEQEQNGLLTYDRVFKFAPEKIHAILSKPSVREREEV